MHLASRVLGVLPATAALLVGLYLLVWAAQWPHSDLRESYAMAAAAVSAGVGSIAAVVVVRARSSILRAVTAVGAVAAAAVGVLAIGVVTSDQSDACGDVLAACESLLPGL